MRVLIWIGEEANQCALSNKISKEFNVVGIVREARKTKSKITVKKIFTKVIEKLFLNSINQAWMNMHQAMKDEFPNYPDVDSIIVENINSDEAYTFSKDLNPDLIIVSGTRLVKQKMLSISTKIGVLNLHTGLSPYIKGGPNCTNWCIATNQFHLIGNTIMWIDLGIDTGNILTTKCVELSGKEDLNELHLKVMNEAHQLYVDAIKYIENGHKQSVPQSEITEGTTYYTRQWDLKHKIELIRNFRNWDRSIDNINVTRKQLNIIEVKLI